MIHQRLFQFHCAPVASFFRCRVQSKSSKMRRVKHWKAMPAFLAALFALLVVPVPILCATDLRGGVVGLAGPLVGVGVALFEVKPNKTLRRIHETVTAPDGKYHFDRVHPGQYVLQIGGVNYPLEVRDTQMQDIPLIAPPRHHKRDAAKKVANATPVNGNSSSEQQ
jgi:hypothetical protein